MFNKRKIYLPPVTDYRTRKRRQQKIAKAIMMVFTIWALAMIGVIGGLLVIMAKT